MRLLLDMNLSPHLCERFRVAGHDAVHWSTVGDPKAPDGVLMDYARASAFIVITHDLDFGAILASTKAAGPSVVQVRTQDLLSEKFVSTILTALRQFSVELGTGALVVVDEDRSRVRVLPIG
jgi:predicted nuclease of predicted toxin-antitoxin system